MTDWKKLEHAHGSAADVPALLAKLDGKVARDRTLAAQQLLERVALPCSALPALTAALLSRLEDAKRKDRAALWGLVVEVVVTEPQRFVFEPFTPPKRAPKPLRDALEALAAAQELLAADVASADVAVSAAASRVAAYLPTPGAALVAEVVKRARQKAANAAKDSAWLTTGTLRRRGVTGAASPEPGKLLHERCVAHLAEAIATASLSLDASLDLARMLASDEADPAQPWGDGDLRNLARGALAHFSQHADAVRDALLEAVAGAKDRERMQNVEVLTRLAFPRVEPVTPRSLDTAQRATLEGLLALGADVALPAHGLPNVASVRAVLGRSGGSEAPQRSAADRSAANVSGTPTPPAIERELTLAAGTRPVWQWFEARLKKEVTDEAVMEAIAENFSAEELWDVVGPAFVAERGHALPTMAFAERMSGKVSLERARLDAYVASALAAGKASKPPRSAFGAFAILRFGSPPEHTQALETLARSAMFGNDPGVVARLRAALPAAVLEAISKK